MSHRSSRYSAVFFQPSFYGALTWTFWLLVYLSGYVDWDDSPKDSLWIFVSISVLFLGCLVGFRGKYQHLIENLSHEIGEPTDPRSAQFTPSRAILILLFSLGLGGLIYHLGRTLITFHGLSNFLAALQYTSYEVRWESGEASLGIQLSYFGWIFCGLVAYYVRLGSLSKRWVSLYLLLFVLNLSFIDRTRPTWILFTSLLMWSLAGRTASFWKTVKALAIALVIFVSLFSAIGIWVGKIGEHSDGDDMTEAILINMSRYGTAGFAFFTHGMLYHARPDYIPRRSMYPLFKALNALKLAEEPPSQVLIEDPIPYRVNVGTFLEPLYEDGGLLYVIIGSLIMTIGAEFVGLYLLASRSPLCYMGWSAVCFMTAFAFFVPRFASTPFWVILGVSIVAAGLRRIFRTPDRHFIESLNPTSSHVEPTSA